LLRRAADYVDKILRGARRLQSNSFHRR
jgi:hypothetical protein